MNKNKTNKESENRETTHDRGVRLSEWLGYVF